MKGRTLLNYNNEDNEATKKGLNYINYSKIEHDIITNSRLPSAYSGFREKLVKYEPINYDRDTTKGFINRSLPFQNKNKQHIRKNIKQIQNISNLNRLKSMSQEPRMRARFSHISERKNWSYGRKDKNCVFFTRSKKISRRFNENCEDKIKKSPKRMEDTDYQLRNWWF